MCHTKVNAFNCQWLVNFYWKWNRNRNRNQKKIKMVNAFYLRDISYTAQLHVILSAIIAQGMFRWMDKIWNLIIRNERIRAVRWTWCVGLLVQSPHFFPFFTVYLFFSPVNVSSAFLFCPFPFVINVSLLKRTSNENFDE